VRPAVVCKEFLLLSDKVKPHTPTANRPDRVLPFRPKSYACPTDGSINAFDCISRRVACRGDELPRMSLQLKCTDINPSKFSSENLASLKEQFPNKENDTLARYLVANNNAVDKAAQQLQRADALSEEYTNVSMKQCINEITKGTAYLHGEDRDGRPLLIVNARMHDPVNRDVKQCVLMTLWWTEQAIARLQDQHSKFTVLVDRANCENDVDKEFMKLLSEVFLVSIVPS
jgi:hypothetical protein